MAFHLLSVEAKYISPKILPQQFGAGQIGVDIFFVISGMVMMLSTEHLIASRATIAEFLRRRFVRVYPIYWFFVFLLLPVYLAAPQLVNSSEGNQVELVSSLLLLPSENLPLLAVAWSLVFELWFYIAFALLLSLPRRFMPIYLAAWLSALTIVWFAAPVVTSPTLKLVTSPYAIEFIIGASSYYLYRYATVPVALVAICTGMLSLTIIAATHASIIVTPTWSRSLLIGATVASILAGFACLEKHGVNLHVRRFAWLGDISYTVYLSHILTLSFIGRCALVVFSGANIGVHGATAFWIVAVACVLIIGWVTHRFVEQPVLSWLKRRSYRAVARSQGASIASGVKPIMAAAPVKSNSGLIL